MNFKSVNLLCDRDLEESFNLGFQVLLMGNIVVYLHEI